MSHKHSCHIHSSNASYVLLEIFMEFVAVRAKIRWNNKGSCFFSETWCLCQSFEKIVLTESHLRSVDYKIIVLMIVSIYSFVVVNHCKQQACKRAASAATQLINSSTVAAKSNSSAASQSQLSAQTRLMSDETIPHVVQALRSAVLMSANDDPTPAQLALVSAAQEMIQVCL